MSASPAYCTTSSRALPRPARGATATRLPPRETSVLSVDGSIHSLDDIERTAEEATLGLAASCIALAPDDLSSNLVVLLEVEKREASHVAEQQLRSMAAAAIFRWHRVAARKVLLVPALSMRLVPHGQDRRVRCAELLRSGELLPLDVKAQAEGCRGAYSRLGAAGIRRRVTRWLALARGVSLTEAGRWCSFLEAGVGGRGMVELAAHLEYELGRPICPGPLRPSAEIDGFCEAIASDFPSAGWAGHPRSCPTAPHPSLLSALQAELQSMMDRRLAEERKMLS